MNRRRFLVTTATAVSAAFARVSAREPEWMNHTGGGLIDVNVNLGRWPVRRLRGDDTAGLVQLLHGGGSGQVWAGTFEGLWSKDIAATNARLVDECRRHGRGLLVPFGSVNPQLPNWEEDLRRCAEVHRMPGIRLHPNYHGYRLEHAEFARLLRLATGQGLIVQLALLMEDERMMHPRFRVEPVDPAPLASVVRATAGLRLVLLNGLGALHAGPLTDLVAAGEVYVEISMLEGVGGVATLLEQVPVSRVLFGSHAPLFYFESARLKLRESALSVEQARAIGHANAQSLLAKRR